MEPSKALFYRKDLKVRNRKRKREREVRGGEGEEADDWKESVIYQRTREKQSWKITFGVEDN